MTDTAGTIHQLQVIIEGRVQGVGFRYATCARAEQLGLCGWVRNLPDGRVEALFEGDQGALETMLDWCHKGPALARVRKVETRWQEQTTPQYRRFDVRGF